MLESPHSMAELPAAWPRGRTIAVSVSVMLEGWSDGAAPGVGPMGNPIKPGILDLQARSWADYGPNVGAWRLLDVLAGAGVTAVFYVSGIIAERYPLLMRAIVEAGHTVAGHKLGARASFRPPKRVTMKSAISCAASRRSKARPASSCAAG